MESVLEIILKLVDKASGGVKGVTSGLTDLESKANKAHARLAPLSNLFGTVLKASAAAATVAVGGLAAGIYQATMDAADMQQKVADVASIMGVGTEAIKPLKDLITDLGMDPRLKVDATEAGVAIEMLAKNGLEMSQIFEGAARNTVLLANATGADFGTAADIATDVMTLFNIQAKDMMTAVNGITGVTTKSKFGINDYRLAIAQAGGVAAMVGVEFDDFNAVIAAIAPSFASGSDAGTSFKTFLQRLVPETNPAKDAMRELGLLTTNWGGAASRLSEILHKEVGASSEAVTAAFMEMAAQQGINIDDTKAMNKAWSQLVAGLEVNAFFEANGQLKDMAKISQALKEATRDLTEEQKIHYMTTIFGTDAMRAAGAMAGMTEESFNKLRAEIAKVDAEEAAKTRMDTLRGSMEILRGVFDGLRQQIGDRFIPIFTLMADRMADFLSANADKIVAWAESLAAKITELLPVAEAILTWMLHFVTTGEKMTVTQMGLSGQTAQLVQGFITFVNWMSNTAQSISNVVNMFGGLKTILTVVGGLIGISVVAQIVAFVGSVVSAVGAVASFVGGLTGLTPVIGGLTALFGPVGIAVAALGLAAVTLYNAWKHNWFGIRDITQQAVQGVKGWLDSVPSWINNIGTGIYNAGRTAFGKLGEAMNSMRHHTIVTMEQVMSDVKEHGYSYAAGAMAGRFYEGMRHVASRMIAGFMEGSPNVAGDVSRVLDGIIGVFNGIMDGFRNHVYAVMRGIGERIGHGLIEGINHLRYNIQNTIQNLTDMIPQWIKDQLGIHSNSAVMRELGRYTMGGFVEGMRDLMGEPQLVLEYAIGGLGETSNTTYSEVNTNWNISMPGMGGRESESQIMRLTNTLVGVYGGKGR